MLGGTKSTRLNSDVKLDTLLNSVKMAVPTWSIRSTVTCTSTTSSIFRLGALVSGRRELIRRVSIRLQS